MGRQSRRKAEKRAGLRQATEKEAIRAAGKADRRGRDAGGTVADFERLASLGDKRIAETLISRHTCRMENLGRLPDWYVRAALSPLAPVTLLDRTLRDIGIELRRFPASFHGTWAEHAAWGVASAVSVARMLLAGQLLGAAAVARQQVERWGLMRASVNGLSRNAGEPIQDFLARAWSHPKTGFAAEVPHEPLAPSGSLADEPDDLYSLEEPGLDHVHVRLSDGSEVCPAVVYGLLSEIMHGDACRDHLSWDAGSLLAPASVSDDSAIAVGVISDAMSLSLKEVKFMVAATAIANNEHGKAAHLFEMPDRFTTPTSDAGEGVDGSAERVAFRNGRITRFAPAPWPTDISRPPLSALMPLLPMEGLDPAVVSSLGRMAKVYEAVLDRRRPAGRLYRDDELATLAFVSHRYSSALGGREMMEREREHFGSEFNVDNLTARGTSHLLVSELAGVTTTWAKNDDVSTASALVASSLRSAFWLWLEDDDRAMAILRCTLEQAARIRVWRLKPARATKLEGSPAASPKDWLNAAGWRRLGPLARALSEFAHAQSNSRWDGARWLLAALQIDADPETSRFTARGSALDLVTTLAAREIIATIRAEHSILIADSATSLLETSGFEIAPADSSLSALFDHIWSHRSMSLGPDQFPKFERPS